VLADGDEPVTDESTSSSVTNSVPGSLMRRRYPGPMRADSPALLRACSYVGLLRSEPSVLIS
jgi:hypothetical protein